MPKNYSQYPEKNNLDNNDIFSFWDTAIGRVVRTSWNNLKQIIQQFVDDAVSGLSFDQNLEWSDYKTPYALDEIVSQGNRLWKSKVANNFAQPPTDPLVIETAEWIEQSKSKSSKIPDYTPGTFTETGVVVEDQGLIYKLIIDENELPFISSDITSEEAIGKWKIIGGSSGSGGTLPLKIQFSELDTSRTIPFNSPIVISEVVSYNDITAIFYSSSIDMASPTFTDHADLIALQSWIDTNITSGTKWLLRVTTDATKNTYLDLKYSA